MMKTLSFIAIAGLMIAPMSACTNQPEATAVTSETNARAAEEAEKEFAKLAEKEHHATTKPSKNAKHAKTAKQERHVASTTAAKAVSKSSVYVVQIGAFKIKENAEKLQSKLKTDGFPVMMRPMNHSKNGMLYVVHLEPTPNKNEAAQWRDQLKTKSSVDSQVVSRAE